MKGILNEKYKNLQQIAIDSKDAYQKAVPFPSVSFDDFFKPTVLDEILNEFPDLSKGSAIKFDNQKENKLAGKGEDRFGEHTKRFMHLLNSQPFLEFLQELTGIKEILIGDPYFVGGGLHEIKKGGLLKIHADFNKHHTIKLDRRINVLVYLNKDWKESYGGHFELWDQEMKECKKRILPKFNTIAIFSTTSHSYHGHPEKLNCPEDRSRKSLALYYYSNGRPQNEIDDTGKEHSTLFKERPLLDDFKREKNMVVKKKRSNIKPFLKDFIPPILLKLKRKLIK